MDATTKNLVRQRAGDCCEYCHLPQDATPFITFLIEHVIAKQYTPDDDDWKTGNDWHLHVTVATSSKARTFRALT